MLFVYMFLSIFNVVPSCKDLPLGRFEFPEVGLIYTSVNIGVPKSGRPLLARVTRKDFPCRAVGILGVHQLSLSDWNGNFI